MNYKQVTQSKITTPFLPIKYATLGTPKLFNKGEPGKDNKGMYSVTFRLDPDRQEHGEFIDELEAMMEGLEEQFWNESGLNPKKITRRIPLFKLFDEEDEEENPTGMKLLTLSKDGYGYRKSDGKVWKITQAVFDSKAQPIPEDVCDTIGADSVGRATFDARANNGGAPHGGHCSY